MKKEVLYGIFIVIGIFLLTLYAPIFKIHKGLSYSPNIPIDCSDNSLTALWNSVLKISSSDTTIVKNVGGDGTCYSFLIYKNNSDELWMIIGSRSKINNRNFNNQ